MLWLVLATVGEFLNASVALLDKYIVTDESAVPKPFVYAFYSCILTGGWVFIYLLGYIPGLPAYGFPTLADVSAPTIEVVGMSFLAAYTFFMALVSMYDSLRYADTSDVIPVIGAVSAVTSLLLSVLLLAEPFPPHFLVAFVLLVTGTLFISRFRFSRSVVVHAIHSGLFFGLHYIAMKGLFIATNFDNGFFWSRICFVLFALSLLLIPVYFEKVVGQTKRTTRRAGGLVILDKILAGVAAFLLLKAVDLSSNVAMVQALDGLKFVIIILLALLLGRFTPYTAGENDFAMQTVLRKVFYVLTISVGYFILFL